MKVEQLYTNCLAEAAYYIESNGEAAVIDPIRETEPYLEKLKQTGAKLKYVFETHFHADFVSGHIDLAKQTGARIIFGPLAETRYEKYSAADGEIFPLGKLKIKVLHTPGHTPESSCFLLLDENGKEYCIFTGDTLFINDVGRPDLLEGKMTKEELASMMYDSLNQKIKTLPDEVVVYPAHGPGSACGKNIGKEIWGTIGQQKKTNYALQEMSRQEFIAAITSGLSSPPGYFFEDAAINKNGYSSIDEVLKKNMKPLSVREFQNEVAAGAIILDTRIPDVFEKGFIRGSLNIGLNGSYAIWLGTLVDISRPLVFFSETGKERESILRAARIGYENVRGYLKGGIHAWMAAGNATDKIQSISPQEFASRVKSGKEIILDVRRRGEFETLHVKNAEHIELAALPANIQKLSQKKNYLIHCASGYRSIIACSLIKASGIDNVVNVWGGFNQIKNTGVDLQTASQKNA